MDAARGAERFISKAEQMGGAAWRSQASPAKTSASEAVARDRGPGRGRVPRARSTLDRGGWRAGWDKVVQQETRPTLTLVQGTGTKRARGLPALAHPHRLVSGGAGLDALSSIIHEGSRCVYPAISVLNNPNPRWILLRISGSAHTARHLRPAGSILRLQVAPQALACPLRRTPGQGKPRRLPAPAKSGRWLQ